MDIAGRASEASLVERQTDRAVGTAAGRASAEVAAFPVAAFAAG